MDRQKFYKMMELKYTASLYIMLFESISFALDGKEVYRCDNDNDMEFFVDLMYTGGSIEKLSVGR
mgnify:FL=1